MYWEFCELQMCSFETGEQTDRLKDRHTDKHTHHNTSHLYHTKVISKNLEHLREILKSFEFCQVQVITTAALNKKTNNYNHCS